MNETNPPLTMRPFLLILPFLVPSFLAVAQANLEVAKQAYKQNNFGEAWKHIKDADSTSLEAQYFKGVIAFALNKTDELQDYPMLDIKAMNALLRAYRLDEEEQYLSAIREDLYHLTLQFLDKSLGAYHQGIKQNNKQDLAIAAAYLQGVMSAYDKLGSYESTVNVMLRDNYYSNIRQVMYYLAHTYDLLDRKMEAAALYEKLMDKRYEQAEVYLNLATIYQERGKEKKAFDMLDKMHRKLPELPRVSLAYAELLGEKGAFKDAYKLVKKSKRRTRKAHPYLTEARLLQMEGRLDAAEQTFAIAQEVDPDEFEVSYSYGKFYHLQAEEMLENIPESKREESNSKYKKVETKLRMALQHYRRAYQLNPKSLDTIRALVEIYEYLDQPDLAEEYRRKLP